MTECLSNTMDTVDLHGTSSSKDHYADRSHMTHYVRYPRTWSSDSVHQDSDLQILTKSLWHPKAGHTRLRLHKGVLTTMSTRSRSPGWQYKVNKWVLVLCGVLLLTGTLPLLSHQLLDPDDPEDTDLDMHYNQADQKLGRILRSLRAIHTDNHEQKRHLPAVNTTRFPVVVKGNILPNYFMGGVERLGSDAYKSSAIVFLHQHRAAPTPVTACLTEILKNQNELGKMPDWNNDRRALWDRKSRSNDLKPKKAVDRVNTGQYSLGSCDLHSGHKCSYFTLLQDPMERAVSSYYFCQQEGLQSLEELCRVIDANDMTLRDWVLFLGSATFHQLIYNDTWCQGAATPVRTYSLGGSSVRVSPSREWPCWLKRRVHTEALSSTERDDLLDHVLRHLESWFSVIGLVSELDRTAHTLEHVYGLPFTKCSKLVKDSPTASYHYDNHANNNKQKKGYYDENDPYYLKYDYFVKKALEADYKIYKKAVKIYKIQRQMLFNTL